ncbi:MAG TPA: NADH-quinone oxidoreductase subunit D [Chloroflexi bacterium]|nr:NADH-quinone oxidoreductase subunit D [Chloroflexota bacterium]
MATEVTPEPTDEVLTRLQERFPGAVEAAPEPYEGLIVARDHLVDVATFLRDEMGYAYLSDVVGVDYPEEVNGLPPRFEVVYHLFRPVGGPLTLHVHADRENPVVPSLVPVFPSANFQEREAWDLVGIRFEGHPDLRRILLWDGFDGHPLRKDWHEVYYEEEKKPFGSRWPEGHPVMAESRTPLGRNLRYPPGWSPEDWRPTTDPWGYRPHDEVAEQKNPAMPVDRVVLNMGPHHPSTHGVLRLLATLEGERIQKLEPMLGFLHRCHEKIGERNTWLGNIPYTDRLDYVCSMTNNWPYVLAVEKLMGVEVPERAEYIRVIMGEFTRFLNHAVSVGFMCNDLGIYFTVMLYALEEREFILDLFEMTAGSRMMCNYMRFGGVAHDMTEEAVALARELAFERLPRFIDKVDAYLTENEIFRARTVGVGVLPPEQAVAYGCTGPLLRGSGVPYDIRRADPYSIYDEFDFEIITAPDGDVYSRYLVRLGEMRESLRILQQALNRLPDGPVMAGKKKATVKVPPGESYGRIEAPKGELGFYIVSDGSPNPYRYHIRAPSFVNLGVMGELCRGHLIADVVIILASIDITLGEVDR